MAKRTMATQDAAQETTRETLVAAIATAEAAWKADRSIGYAAIAEAREALDAFDRPSKRTRKHSLYRRVSM